MSGFFDPAPAADYSELKESALQEAGIVNVVDR